MSCLSTTFAVFVGMLPLILTKIKQLGHEVFTQGDYNLNLFGVRASTRDANAFDDVIGCAYKDSGLWRVEWWEATTDPGTWYLTGKPLNPAGTAILKPDQYRGVYRISKHQGRYDALCQRDGKVSVYRDNTKDRTLDLDEATLETGMFGINLHKRKGSDDTVDGASAGCQVFRWEKAFNRMMHLARKQVAIRRWDTFTYTLVNEADIR